MTLQRLGGLSPRGGQRRGNTARYSPGDRSAAAIRWRLLRAAGWTALIVFGFGVALLVTVMSFAVNYDRPRRRR